MAPHLHISYPADDNPSRSSNTPAHPHGSANSHSPPERYTPASPVRLPRTYSEQLRSRPWCSRLRSYCRRHI